MIGADLFNEKITEEVCFKYFIQEVNIVKISCCFSLQNRTWQICKIVVSLNDAFLFTLHITTNDFYYKDKVCNEMKVNYLYKRISHNIWNDLYSTPHHLYYRILLLIIQVCNIIC